MVKELVLSTKLFSSVRFFLICLRMDWCSFSKNCKHRYNSEKANCFATVDPDEGVVVRRGIEDLCCFSSEKSDTDTRHLIEDTRIDKIWIVAISGVFEPHLVLG